MLVQRRRRWTNIKPALVQCFMYVETPGWCFSHDVYSSCSGIWREDVHRYPVWLGRLTHLLRVAQSHWPPFCLHSQLCKNDARAAYQKNSDAKKLRRIFQVPLKTGSFPAGVNLWSYRTMTFKNGGHCVRALRCHQGSLLPIFWQEFTLIINFKIAFHFCNILTTEALQGVTFSLMLTWYWHRVCCKIDHLCITSPIIILVKNTRFMALPYTNN